LLEITTGTLAIIPVEAELTQMSSTPLKLIAKVRGRTHLLASQKGRPGCRRCFLSGFFVIY
jgi:hypothetical protein